MNDLNLSLKPVSPPVQAVIFDLGGVILRTDDSVPRTRLAERMGKTRLQLEEIVFNNPISQQAEEGLATLSDVWENVRQALSLKPEEVRAFRREFFAGDRVDFELIRLLRALRPTYRTALLSNTWIVDLPRFLTENLNIPEDTFDVIVSSAAHGAAKPKLEIYQAVVQKLQVHPGEAVFVDDSDRNIEGAQKAGLQAIRFRGAAQAIRDLSQLISLP